MNEATKRKAKYTGEQGDERRQLTGKKKERGEGCHAGRRTREGAGVENKRNAGKKKEANRERGWRIRGRTS